MQARDAQMRLYAEPPMDTAMAQKNMQKLEPASVCMQNKRDHGYTLPVEAVCDLR